MARSIEELNQIIKDTEESLKDPSITDDAELVVLLNEELSKAKLDLEKLETEANKAKEDAEQKLKDAKKDGDKNAEKKAKETLVDATNTVKEIGKVGDKLEKTGDKVDTAEEKAKKHGGHRQGAGRKPSPDKVVKPKGKRGGFRKGAGRKPVKTGAKKTMKVVSVSKKKGRKLMKPSKAVAIQKSKEKSVTAFGQTVKFKNDAEFCIQLIKAFKKRRLVYKTKRTRTKPVFAIVTSKTADALNKAVHNLTPKQIKSNPKKVMADLKNAEKKAKEFLESLKPLMGSDYKHSEIAKEFGEIEQVIKRVFAKYNKQ